jgi:hypothetical protein
LGTNDSIATGPVFGGLKESYDTRIEICYDLFPRALLSIEDRASADHRFNVFFMRRKIFDYSICGPALSSQAAEQRPHYTFAVPIVNETVYSITNVRTRFPARRSS